MIKAVFFDLDGTLLNRDESVRKFIDSQYERLNKWLSHIPKAQYVSRFMNSIITGMFGKIKYISKCQRNLISQDYRGKNCFRIM